MLKGDFTVTHCRAIVCINFIQDDSSNTYFFHHSSLLRADVVVLKHV